MDQDAFLETYNGITPQTCSFGKGILSGQCQCSLASKRLLAEREGVDCKANSARNSCQSLFELLRQHSRFALKISRQTAQLPHGQVMRIQIGGLRGLYGAVYPDRPQSEIVEDVHGLVVQAIDRFGSLEQLPFQEIIKQIAGYRLRGHRPAR